MQPVFPYTFYEPQGMPRHYSRESLHLDFASATRADFTRQNFSVCPRYWYIDATFRCHDCRLEFCFTAKEQKVWYEEHQFYVDSLPKRCPACRREQRKLKAIRKEYNETIAAALEADDVVMKQRLITLIDELCELDDKLPAKILENRRILAVQIARSSRSQGFE